ncbi:MAG: carboxynorspermidine decarboxylase [Candidatus Omnitrophota bacterium]
MMIDKIPSTPSYVVDKALLKKNLNILRSVKERAECEILLALKGFSMFGVFDEISSCLGGTSASSLNEARLGFEEFGPNVHVSAPAYREDEFEQLIKYASHIIFNSFSQRDRFAGAIKKSGKKVRCGLRVNPQHSEVKTRIYDPCAPFSRLGVKRELFDGQDLNGISGLHFHNLCELGSDSLERTLIKFEKDFSHIIKDMEWVNFGGGHHITRDDYDIDKLCFLVSGFRQRYGVEIYLEPGEAVVLNTGFLAASVLDIVKNDMEIAILDTSAAAHMPDVLEMPYRPEIEGAGKAGEYVHTYRLGGMTCLAGDIIGDYSFQAPLKPGDRVLFKDMAHYTMVKNSTFNGIGLPSIAVYDPDTDEVKVLREFGYEDYKGRLS